MGVGAVVERLGRGSHDPTANPKTYNFNYTVDLLEFRKGNILQTLSVFQNFSPFLHFFVVEN